MPSATQAVSLGVLVLFVAFLVPVLISAPAGGTAIADATLNDDDGGIENINDALRVQIGDKSASSANVSVTSLESGESASLLLSEEQSGQVTLDNQTVTVTALDIESGSDGQVHVEIRYPSDFTWNEETRRLSSELSLVFAALGLLIVLGLIGWMVS